MPFIKGFWVEPPKSKEKRKIPPSQVNLSFLLGRPVGKTYRIVQSILISSPMTVNSMPTQLKDIDRKVLEKSIMSKLDTLDKKYMKLVSFNTTRAMFEFDWEKWIRDSLSNVNPNNKMSKFEQRFKFKQQVPKMIAFSTTRDNFNSFILRKFKEYMEKNRKRRTWFEKFLPREISGKIRKGLSTMFDYNYDWQTNEIVAKLKTQYIMGILFAVGTAIDMKNKQKYVKIDFEKSVKRKAKHFNKKKWESFIKKRFI